MKINRNILDLWLKREQETRDFNAIVNRPTREGWWSVLKTWMKQRVKEFVTVRECVDTAFKKCPSVYA